MTVSELIDRLREFDAHSEVYLYLDRRRFAPPVWVGLMDTAGLFDEEKNFQLVISPWEPEGHHKPESDEQQARRKALCELVAYDQELGLSDDKKRDRSQVLEDSQPAHEAGRNVRIGWFLEGHKCNSQNEPRQD
jgi:hypothetical protein